MFNQKLLLRLDPEKKHRNTAHSNIHIHRHSQQTNWQLDAREYEGKQKATPSRKLSQP